MRLTDPVQPGAPPAAPGEGEAPSERPGRDVEASNYRWVIVAILWSLHAVAYLNISSLGVLAPFIKNDLQLTSAEVGILISALSIGASLSQLPVGLLSDFAGVRLMLTFAIVLIGFLLAMFSLAPTYPIALAALLIYGLANGMISPTTSKSILDWFPKSGRATAMGIKQTGVNFGGIMAGFLLPLLTVYLTWRNTLLALGLAEAAMAVLVYKVTRESPRKSNLPLAPLAWKKMFQMALHRDMLILGAISFCFMACQFSYSTYLTLFLTREMHYPIAKAGQYFALSYFVGALGRVLWSLASDYWLDGRRKGVLFLIALILCLSSLALGALSFFPASSPLLLIIIFAFGVSGIGWNAIYLTIVGEAVGKESVALATGAGFFYGFLGSLVGPPFFGFLVDKTGIYGYAWFFLALCAGAVLLLLGLYREKGRV